MLFQVVLTTVKPVVISIRMFTVIFELLQIIVTARLTAVRAFTCLTPTPRSIRVKSSWPTSMSMLFLQMSWSQLALVMSGSIIKISCMLTTSNGLDSVWRLARLEMSTFSIGTMVTSVATPFCKNIPAVSSGSHQRIV